MGSTPGRHLDVRLLIVTDHWPMPDRNSADFRLTRLLHMLRDSYEVWLAVAGERAQRDRTGTEAVARYKRELEAAGIRNSGADIKVALRARPYLAVVFEWHFPAVAWLDAVRHEQPDTRVVIDSVDVVFHRLEAKARVTGRPEDIEHAAATRRVELDVYRRADLVITVTDADAAILRDALLGTATFTVPNIHPMHPPVQIDASCAPRLLFIGSYARPGGETNIDAMRWFCSEILPLVVAEEPEATLRIVGGPRIDEIASLASSRVEVLGFVPETQPYLSSSGISIAPLRFGGGMKGKIGEAMSFALPVVTTATGIEGFGLVPGREVLVGDTPRTFADHVLALLRDAHLRERIRMAGYAFIRDRYSDVAVKARVHELMASLGSLHVKRVSLASLAKYRGRQVWERHMGWRFKGG